MATSTENYNFKKPDESDFYDIADENKNWDLADEALKNLDTPTFEDYTGSTAVPAATDAINQMKSKRKLGVLLSNIKAAFKGACLIGHIVNNCVTDNAGLPLSAAQGKVLKDLYTQLYSDNIDSLSSASQLTHSGFYAFLTITSKVNADAGEEIMSEYTSGDFYGVLIGKDISADNGCRFGTLIITSPRINSGIWGCTIWEYKFIHWYKIKKQ